MSSSKKEYDPLSGLFGGGGSPLPDVADDAHTGADAPEPGNVRSTQPASRSAGPPAGPDPAQLAKILARAAAAKAGAPARPAASEPAPTTLGGRAIPGPSRPAAPPPTPAPVAKAAPKPAASAAPVAPAAGPGGRLAGLAAPAPKKSMSATEAIEAARVAEAARAATPKAAAPAAGPPSAPRGASLAPVAAPAPADVLSEDQLIERAQRYVASALPGAPLYVANAMLVDDRGIQRPLWKAHRARILASGDYELAFAVAAVAQALNDVPAGQLLAALAVRDGGELLVWFDTRDGRVISALAGGAGWGIPLA